MNIAVHRRVLSVFVAEVSFLIFLVLQFVILKFQYSTANLQRLKLTIPLLKILRGNGSFSKYKLVLSRLSL